MGATMSDMAEFVERAIPRAVTGLVEHDTGLCDEVVLPGLSRMAELCRLERIADRVTNMGEDLGYLQTGAIEELG